ncbi:MAG: M23 family metallopeptidase, partial [Duncaniella sp.]|nr:M23 family metallopeptidase [Duncaniella sp.]
QPHPTLPNVETENSGIDIETRPGANVRAVFAGTVSAIFRQDGFNSIVMLRHGNYITVYAGLGSVSVKSGQNVTAGQTLGTVYTPSGDSPLLHFEIRREREKLNPQAWVR